MIEAARTSEALALPNMFERKEVAAASYLHFDFEGSKKSSSDMLHTGNQACNDRDHDVADLSYKEWRITSL